MKHAVLVLEDGSTWIGVGFGAETKISGEIVFNTGMVGYVQSITDPSFFGQIVCQTYPLIGNYGVGPTELESHHPQIWGYIVSELCRKPSHYRSERSLDEWLKKHNIPGIEGVDTRELTKTLRVKGTMLGILEVSRDKIDEKKLKDLAEELNLQDKILFLGHINHNDLPKYYSMADIFVRPSLSEGLGNVFLEAMACGTPIIGTPVGGIPDFLKNSKTGLFCEVNNPQDITQKIKEILGNDSLKKTLAENGLKLVQKQYSWDKISGTMENIFRKLI